MNENALKSLLGEVLREVSREHGARAAVCGREFERRLPALLLARDPASGIELAQDATEAIVARAIAASATLQHPETKPRHVRLPLVLLNGWAKPETWRRRQKWGFGIGVASIAAIIALAILVYGPWRKRDYYVSPREGPIPGTTAPGPQLPAPRPHTPERIPPRTPRHSKGPVVKIERKNPGAIERRNPVVASEKARKIGKFGEAIYGSPLVYGREGGNPQVARRGTIVALGSRIVTQDTDRAEILLDDGSVLQLGFNTTLIVPNGRRSSDAGSITSRDFELTEGSVFAMVATTADKEKFTVRTPVATAEALGTEFFLGLENIRPAIGELKGTPKLRAMLQVRDGRVRFYNAIDGVVATKMTESTAVAGSAPTQPRRLERLKVHLFKHQQGHTTLTEYTLTLSAGEARSRFVLASNPHAPRLSDPLAKRLEEATLPALSGKIDASIYALHTLATNFRDAAVINNLGVAHEMKDEFGPAIRSYQAAVRLDPRQALYRFNLGFALQRIGNWQRSTEEFDMAVRLNPNNEHAIKQLAHDYDLLEQYEEALAVLEAGLARLPNSSVLWMSKGTVYFDWSRFAEAEKAYLRTIELSPNNADAWYQLAYTYRFQEREIEAERAFRRAVEIAPNDTPSLVELAKSLDKLNRLQDAEAAYQHVLQLDPNSGMAHAQYAWLLERTGRIEEAEAHYRKALDLDPQDGATFCNLANLLKDHFTDRQKEAESLYRKSIELMPFDENPHRGLAELLTSLGRIQEAEALYRKVIDFDPAESDGYGHLGLYFESQNRIEEAATMYRKAADLDHRVFEWHPDLVRALGKLGRFQEPVPILEEAVQISPETEWLQALLGWSLIENHRWEQAVSAYRKCLELAPNGPNALNATNNLVNALLHTGELVEAEKLVDQARAKGSNDAETLAARAYFLAWRGIGLDEALELAKTGAAQPNADAWYWEVLGFTYFKRGEYDLAIEPLEKAVRGFGKVYLAADALVTLGQVYEAKKDVAGAIGAYRRALVVEPGNQPATEALKRLGR